MSIETYGRYQLLKKLATGGMAQIYLARQEGVEGFEKLVVVKRILPHLAENDEFITMFLDEARIAARLNHPNVVQIFDLGSQDDTFYIAMEYIHGEDVRRVWKEAERLGTLIPVPLICRMIIDACNGLDYAHKKTDQGGRPLNIVHRDISPQNLLVSFEGHVKIVDFGIAKAANQATVTRSGVLKGKYSYMSPEQAGGRAMDCRTDIFALGVVLYELLTGARLFKRSSDLQTLNAVMECAIAPPSKVNDRSPADLDAIVVKALAKERSDRYPEARALAADLEEWLLAHKLPSSTAHLAAFMQDLYAERLSAEAEEGRLRFVEAEGSKGGELDRATPASGKGSRPTRSLRGAQSRPLDRASGDETAAERPAARSGASSRPRSLDRAIEEAERGQPGGTEASFPTETNRSPAVKALWLVLAALASLAVGSLAALLMSWTSRPPDPAPTPEPAPAHLRLDGKEGLTRPGAIAGAGGPAQAAVKVKTSFGSEPPGATVRIDQAVRGITPLDLDFAPGAAVVVSVELDGFVPVTEGFQVGAEAGPPHHYVLSAARKLPEPQKAVHRSPPEAAQSPRPSPAARAATSPVAFHASDGFFPTVECDNGLKDQLPFAPVEMTVGEHRCTYSHSGMASRTVTIKVVAGGPNKVRVDPAP